MNKKTIREVNWEGQKVLVRVDFNVPLKDGAVADDTRIRAALPTINYLLDHGAAVILCSHLGRPKGASDPSLSLRPVAAHLAGLLSHPVSFAEDCIGPVAEAAASGLQPGQVLVLENTRFHPGEKANDPQIARQLAGLAGHYVNDAFGSAHRAHASTVGVADYLPAAAGFLLEKEIAYLDQAIADPARPFVAILGGAKVSDKIGVIRNLLQKADRILIGGGMANTFIKAQGIPVGDSLVEDEVLADAREILEAGGDKIRLPVDVVIADRFDPAAEWKSLALGPVPDGWRIMDIGPDSIEVFRGELEPAGTIVWNGPMGVFEFPPFATGTFAIAKIVADSEAKSIIGGGDSIAAVYQSGVGSKIDHISTGGGASLEMLEGKVLPGLAALDDAS